MKPVVSLLALSAPLSLTLLLGACGADPAPGPVEQIVVEESDTAKAEPAAATSESVAGGESQASLAEAGQAAFAICSGCHSVEAGAAAMAGPNLHGVVGRAAGAAEGFAYSDALKSSGITWSEAELDAYIANPVQKVPGTTMAAGALTDAEQRKAVIAYLKDASAS